jgi:predicted MFS family arabinose efflux permease
VQGFNLPVRMVAIGSLARPEKMSQAIATSSIAVSLARSVGPAIAGIVMVSGHVAGVFVVNALSYLAMIAAILWLRRPLDRPSLSSRKERLLTDIAAGVDYIRNTPRVATIFLLALGFAVLARPFVELFPAIAGDVLRGGPETLSMLMTAQGIGALCGALFMLKPKPMDQTVRITFGAALGIALTLIVFSLTTQLHTVLLAIGVAGVFHVVCNIGMQTMAQTMSDPAMKGRVMSSYGLIFRAAPAIGATVLGAFAEWVPAAVADRRERRRCSACWCSASWRTCGACSRRSRTRSDGAARAWTLDATADAQALAIAAPRSKLRTIATNCSLARCGPHETRWTLLRSAGAP